ncbi:MAG TPA: VWA domain-containing protein [Bacteroidota bacterium]|nr:VWA domain-containing protein [Bacteroidota bacterium]
MKSLFFTISAIALLSAVQIAPAMSRYSNMPGDLILSGNLNQTCIPHRGGTVFLQMQLDARNFPTPEQCARPMNLAVVLDRSGSMADEHKIVYAKQSIDALIDRLTSNDYLSITIYDDRVETLLPTQRVTDRGRIKRLVDGIYPRGSTNLGGGMQEGFRQIERNFKEEYVNRVILLSDGLANQGITDPRKLSSIASEYRNRGISLSTIGVGLDYNENLMLGLAEGGGGNYYFVESPSQLASIFEKELNGLAYIVVQNARIELALGRGVSVNDVIGCEHRREGNRWIIPVGDISATEHREFTVELNIPEGSGTLNAVSGTLRYDGKNSIRSRGFSAGIRYSDITAELEKSKDLDTQGKVDIAVSTRQVEKAMEAIDEGRGEDAQKQVGEALLMLESSVSMNSAVAAPAVQSQILQLKEYSDTLKDGSNMARAKKSIQYKNYRTQKKKE